MYTLLALQQLGGHRHRDHLGLFAFDAIDANRAGDAVKVCGAKAFGLQAVAKSGPFGVAANQAKVGQVLLLARTQQTSGQEITRNCYVKDIERIKTNKRN